MAVVNNTSDLIHDYLDDASVAADPVQARGRVIKSTGTVANATTDSNLSNYHLVDLPSDCMMDQDTFFKVDGWGFAQIVIGTLTDTTALVNQTKITAAIVSPFGQGDANHGKRLWEALGMAADPGGNISLYAHAVAAATGAGTMPFQAAYLYH